MLPISGKSVLEWFKSKEQGVIDATKKYVFSGRERHSSSRYLNRGYPQRAIRSHDYLLVWNMKPERWPAGAPQRLKPGTKGELLPMYGIDENGKHHSDWAFTDIDAAPTKSFIIENRQDEILRPYFDWAHAKRPEFELFDIKKDSFNLNNLAGNPDYAEVEEELKQALTAELKKSGDPRIIGPDTEVFDSYIRYVGPMREFQEPKE
jgi:uncharacterized sulfatase